MKQRFDIETRGGYMGGIYLLDTQVKEALCLMYGCDWDDIIVKDLTDMLKEEKKKKKVKK